MSATTATMPQLNRRTSLNTRAPLRFLPLVDIGGGGGSSGVAARPVFAEDIFSPRGQVLSSMIQAQVLENPRRRYTIESVESAASSSSQHYQRRRTSTYSSDGRMAVAVSAAPEPAGSTVADDGSAEGEEDGNAPRAAPSRNPSFVLVSPHVRSMRLIGNSNPRYQWHKYYKTKDELKAIKNRKVQYLFIDRLLDSSLPYDLLQDYTNQRPTPKIPTTITEEPPTPDTPSAPPSDFSTSSPTANGAEEGGNNASSTAPHRIKRRPREIYRLPSETTPLVADDDRDAEAFEAGAHGGDDDAVDAGSSVVSWAIAINMFANTLLLAGKIAVIVLTSSLSLLASLVDAALDFLSTAIIYVVSKLIARHDQYRYPVGRRRLEPIGVLVFSVVMITSFVQVAIECFNRLTSGDRTVVQLGTGSIAIMIGTVVIKGLCWFWCRLVNNSSVQALAQDAMTDVIFNTFSIIFPLIGFFLQVWWLDALGGLLLSAYVIGSWARTSALHIRNLSGASASADERNVLLYLPMRFAEPIQAIQGLQAYHVGDKLNVEVDLVLRESMSLRDAHDLGESLQYVLESVPAVDRAFVHLDYRADNLPSHMEQQD